VHSMYGSLQVLILFESLRGPLVTGAIDMLERLGTAVLTQTLVAARSVSV